MRPRLGRGLCSASQIAAGAASEVEYQLLLAHDLSIMGQTLYLALDAQTTEVKRMLASLIQTVKS